MCNNRIMRGSAPVLLSLLKPSGRKEPSIVRLQRRYTLQTITMTQ